MRQATLRQQADRLLRSQSKSGDRRNSIRTSQTYAQVLAHAAERISQDHEIRRLKDITPEMITSYLQIRADEVGQKQLDQDRISLERLPQIEMGSLARTKTSREEKLEGRAYSQIQVDMIRERQSERHSLATLVAAEAGLRAHELHTLQTIDERAPMERFGWKTERWEGREEWARYTVIGKGGLCREVRISQSTADQLEGQRLNEPLRVTDRGVHYTSHYDLPGGQAWSKAFTRASKTELGWSTGAHGLRHSYAQDRLAYHQNHGHRWTEARELTSQELGHFRPSITNTYLR